MAPTNPSTDLQDPPPNLPPNHHAGHAGFSGLSGFFAGLTMTIGRGPMARLAADLAAVTAADAVVDIGCGPGVAAREAARRGAQVTGVDPARVMRRFARLLSFRSSRVAWVDGVAERLPLADGSMSVAWALSTVHHWPDLDGAVREAARVLRPGGRLVVIERLTTAGATGLASHGWTDAQAAAFADRCRSAGFVDVEVSHERTPRSRLLVVRAIRRRTDP